ncbi:MAG: GIY-YIG nuclease family protein [Bacteroidetes bacterium]|nr:GIY-YIG nuclease family protein [Bacteroidota bacterium]
MVKHFCYIIYSPTLNKFYVGETSDFNRRLIQHNQNFFPLSYTSKAKDWLEFLVIVCEDPKHARNMESFIKKMKSRKFIESLKTEPEKLNDIITKMKV